MELENGGPWHWSLDQTFSGKQSGGVYEHILPESRFTGVLSPDSCIEFQI